jgi:DUF1680 family protein
MDYLVKPVGFFAPHAPRPKLEAYLDDVIAIAKIAATQEEDGYLYMARTINS